MSQGQGFKSAKDDLNDAVKSLTAVLQGLSDAIKVAEKNILDKVNEHSVTLGEHSVQLLNLQHRMPPPDNPGGGHF